MKVLPWKNLYTYSGPIESVLLSEAISKVEDLKLATCKQTKISSFFKA